MSYKVFLIIVSYDYETRIYKIPTKLQTEYNSSDSTKRMCKMMAFCEIKWISQQKKERTGRRQGLFCSACLDFHGYLRLNSITTFLWSHFAKPLFLQSVVLSTRCDLGSTNAPLMN